MNRSMTGSSSYEAAMEPAVDRREQPVRRPAASDLTMLAAMEPAVEGGTQLAAPLRSRERCDMPQWSPPLIGGSSAGLLAGLTRSHPAAMEPAVDRREQPRAAGRRQRQWPPQWSPPSIGGNSQATRTWASGTYLPQWSPPLIGGNRSCHPAAMPYRQAAAMEPAVDRREQSTRPSPKASQHRRNGARR